VSNCDPLSFLGVYLESPQHIFFLENFIKTNLVKNKMSDNSHLSSEQGSDRENNEDLNLREEVKRLRENEIKRER